MRRFIGIGTCFEYDLTKGMLSVETPLRPLTPYAGAKADVFMALSQWLSQQGVEFAWCRLFYLHGDGEDKRRLVPYLRAKLAAGEPAELTSGNQIRDFLDVSEAGRMIVKTALSDEQGPVNICAGSQAHAWEPKILEAPASRILGSQSFLDCIPKPELGNEQNCPLQ